MTKLTDDEVARLLRETFADKENLVDHLPEATTPGPRRKGPVLLAAASVLAVLGGVLYVGNVTSGQDPNPAQTVTKPATVTTPPQPSSATPSYNHTALIYAEAWAAAIREMAKWEQPAAGWPALIVLDASYEGAGSPAGERVRGTPFTADEKAAMERLLAPTPIQWVRDRPTGAKVCDQPAARSPYITVAPITRTDNAGIVEIGINLWRGCLDARWLTYRLEASGGWKVTGTVGPEAVA